MVDGSMRFTDVGWQEVNVGRVFQHYAPAGALAGRMGPSHYMARRGPFAAFTQRFEQVLPPDTHSEQVFVTDGAQWIHWLQECYPPATPILDFCHVAEKLAAAQAAGAPATWLPAQYARLWAGQSPAVEKAVAAFTGPAAAAGEPTRRLPAHQPRPNALRFIPATRAALRQRARRSHPPHPALGAPQAQRPTVV